MQSTETITPTTKTTHLLLIERQSRHLQSHDDNNNNNSIFNRKKIRPHKTLPISHWILCTITSLDERSLYPSLLPMWPTFTNITFECDAIFFSLFDCYWLLIIIINNNREQSITNWVSSLQSNNKGCNGIEIERKRMKPLTYSHIFERPNAMLHST